MPGFWDDIKLYAEMQQPELPSEDESERILKGETVDMMRNKTQEARVKAEQPPRGSEAWARQTMGAMPEGWSPETAVRPEEVKSGSPDPYLERYNEAQAIMERIEQLDRERGRAITGSNLKILERGKQPAEFSSRDNAVRAIGEATVRQMNDPGRPFMEGRPLVVPMGRDATGEHRLK